MHLLNMRNILVAIQWCHPLALRRLALATLIAFLVLMPQMAKASELLTNGNFGTGNLTGWTTATGNGVGVWTVYSGSPSGVPAPTGYGVASDLDTTNAGVRILFQSFVADAASLTVSYGMYLWTPGSNQFADFHDFSLSNFHQEAWV